MTNEKHDCASSNVANDSDHSDHDSISAERIRTTVERAKRTRAHLRHFEAGQFKFDPQAQPLFDPDGMQGKDNVVNHHDVLVIAPKARSWPR